MRSSDDEKDPWWGTARVAQELGESAYLVRQSLRDQKRADELYGPGNWKNHLGLLSRKREFGVRRSAVLNLKARAVRPTGK